MVTHIHERIAKDAFEQLDEGVRIARDAFENVTDAGVHGASDINHFVLVQAIYGLTLALAAHGRLLQRPA